MRHVAAFAAALALLGCDSKPPPSGTTTPPVVSDTGAPPGADPLAGFPRGEQTFHFGANPARTNIKFDSVMQVMNIPGVTNRVQGTATIDFEAGKGSCALVVPAETLQTGMDDRDRAMHGVTYLDAKKFPTIEFKSEKASFTAPSTWKIDGKFTFHGQTKDISVTADVKRVPPVVAEKVKFGPGHWVKVKVDPFKINITEYGVKIPQNAVATVNPEWTVDISIYGTTEKPDPATLAIKKKVDEDEPPKVVRVPKVTPDGLEGARYDLGSKSQLTNLSATSETEIESITASTHSIHGLLGIDLQKGTGKVKIRTLVSTLKSGIDLRDEHLRGPDWLDAAKFPEIYFESTSAARKEGTTWDVEGNFTMHGVTNPVKLSVQVKEIPVELVQQAKWGEKPGLSFSTRFALKLSDFGVKLPAAAAGKVKDEWMLSVDLKALLSE